MPFRITLNVDVLDVVEEYGEIIGVDDTTQVVNAILKRIARMGVSKFFDQSRADSIVSQHIHNAQQKNAVNIANARVVHVGDDEE